MNERLSKLTQVAKETKIALYDEWKKKQCFEDYNNFMEAGRGVLSEAMGLTSVMLLYVCFAENKGVYAGTNDPDTLAIVEKALNFLYDSVESEGYTISPLRSVEETEGVIDKNHAYVDTLTWVLSSSVLTIYAIRQGLISLSEELERKAIELIADALAHIAHGQLQCGAWGFSVDKDAKPSLYSTYAVAASLGDFLDYIFGELEYYSSDDISSKNIEDFYDWKTVDAINTYYRETPKDIYPQDNITEVVAKIKSNLQMWLLENCLPILPKLAECNPLSDEEMARIGMVRQTSSETITKLGGKDYINLYYTYYIIDILTTSSSDKRFDNIAKGTDSVAVDDIKKIYKGIMSESDYAYFFEKNSGANFASMFNDYLNQAIHSARTNFGMARRSGKAFWDSSASELIIPWEHNEISKTRIEEARGDIDITEPALVSMALRANTVYCFYIIERADITVDNMFDMICDDRSPKTETVKKDTKVKNLWDCINYSLPVTERSIEALVDYSDYLNKTLTEQVSGGSEGAASSIDDAINKKIINYINSDEGKKTIKSLGFVSKDEVPTVNEADIARIVDEKVSAIINEKLGAVLSGQQASTPVHSPSSAALDFNVIINEIENLQRTLGNDKLPERDSADEYERLASALIGLHKNVSMKAIQDALTAYVFDDKTLAQILSKLESQFQEITEIISKNWNNPSAHLDKIYRKLIAGSSH